MLSLLKTVARTVGLDTRQLYHSLSVASLKAAARDQNLNNLISLCREAVPDLSAQYTAEFEAGEYEAYWEIKMRGVHAFQVNLALDALTHLDIKGATIADIGDSSGTHGAYIKAIAEPGSVGQFISVNLDPTAVKKIQANGGEAILCRAEDLDHHLIKPDLYLSFEMLEHLTDPVRFLHDLSSQGSASFAAISVPYRRTSRFGGDLIRQSPATLPQQLTAERTHIFELNPSDWQQLAQFAGWRTVEVRIYRQYPRYHPLRAMAPLWRKLDFEGFLGLILEKDSSLSNRYQDW